MAMTLEHFVAQLDESGVISAVDIAAFQKSQSPAAESAEDLAKLLVKHKKVTKLQAQLVYQGKGNRLLLGNYLILDKIGAGGMGDVYLAEHRRMKRQVALKTLPAAMTKDAQSSQRFQREVQAAAKLTHPNIVAAYDADEANGVHYFVMEYVEGIDLSAVVKKRGVLKVDVAVDYILQAAKGLEFAHNKGVIHRDIKPANMLLDNEGTIKILDMGLARIEDEAHEIPATQLTQDGSVMGTVDYMAPEQAKDTHTADARSDIYSLGCSLYYLLTGESVYRGSTMVNRIMAHQNDPIPSLTGKHILISQDVDAVFQKMVAKKPEDRFQSMSEVIVALENCVQMKSSPTVSTEPSDLELHKFLQSQRMASSPTVSMSADVMTAEKPLTDTQNETLTSGFLNNTLGGTSFQPLQKRKQSIGKRGGIIAGVVLASLILLAGIVLKVDTAAGTIILEIDQPELAGAVVSVDDQKKITIKTGEGKEPIEVVADEKTHTLQVTKGGFETFTKQFTVKAGGKETIKVRLEPLVVATEKKPSAGTRAKDNYALEFDGQDDYVEIPELSPHFIYPFTVEVTVLCRPREASNLGGRSLITLPTQDAEKGIIEYKRQWASYTRTTKQTNCMSLAPLPFDRKIHITAIFDGLVPRMFIDGKEEKEEKEIWTGALPEGYLLGDILKKPIQIGRGIFHAEQPGKTYFNGIIDEVRISNIARYSKDFTPTKRFENDEHTMALYHFDEGKGDVLKDSSGNGHDGKIVGAKWVKVDDELQVIEPATTGDKSMTDREIAEWVIGMGGVIGIDGNNIYSKVEELPTEPFQYAVIKLKNAGLEDNDLAPLANVRTLRALYLDFNPLHDTGLQYLKGLNQLETLSIPNSEITDKGLSHLKELPKLRDLNVADSAITNSGMKAIGDLKQLDTLKIAMNSQIDDTGLGYIERLTKLEKLYAHVAPRITDEGLKHLKGMKLLSVLTLATTGITDAGLEQLAGFENLSELDITNCKITDSGLEHLKGSKNLKKLTLNMTPVTDLGLQHLHGLKKLESLNLQETKVTPQGIADLQKALPNCKIVSDFGNKLPPPEKDNYALEFDGKDDYVVIDEFNLPSMKESDQFTVEMRCLLPEPNDQLAMVIWVNKCIKIFSGASVDGKTGGWRCISRSEIDKKSVIPFATKPTDHKRFMHLAAVWDGKLLRFFTDGERYGFGTPVPPPLEKGDNKIYLGAEQQTNKDLNMLFKGSIDEVRISDIARYTKDFTPAKRFKIDEHTMALYHFDEAEGDVLKDSSGNGHDGKIVGAKWVKVDDNLQVIEPATKSDSPMTDREVAEWVIGMGGVVGINSKYYSKIEELPTDPVKFTSVSLKTASFEDHDLQRLAKLKTLVIIRLESASISDTGLQYLRDMQNLEQVYLDQTKITDEGIQYLRGLQNLRVLSLPQTKITGEGLGSLKDLPKLMSIDVNGAAITNSGMKAIGDLKQLTSLNIAGNSQIDDTGFGYIEGLTKLEGLFAYHLYRITDEGLKHLKGMRNLKDLRVGSHGITDKGMEQLAGFEKLSNLTVDNSKITDSGLKNLKDLKNLNALGLRNTPITDVGLKHLESMKKLQYLVLQETKVTPQGISELQKALPECKIISDFETKPPATKAP